MVQKNNDFYRQKVSDEIEEIWNDENLGAIDDYHHEHSLFEIDVFGLDFSAYNGIPLDMDGYRRTAELFQGFFESLEIDYYEPRVLLNSEEANSFLRESEQPEARTRVTWKMEAERNGKEYLFEGVGTHQWEGAKTVHNHVDFFPKIGYNLKGILSKS